jgi:hypothetical protein
MDRQPIPPVQDRRGVPFLLLGFDLGLRIRRAAGALLFVIGEAAVLLEIVSNMRAVVEMRILSTRLQELTGLLIRGSSGVDWDRVVDMSSMRAVVHMLVLMFPGDRKRRVRVSSHARHGRAVMLAVGHG